MTDETSDAVAADNAWCESKVVNTAPLRDAFREGFRAGLAHERVRQAELNTTHVFVTPASVGSHFRRELFNLRAAGHTEEQERRGLNSHATNAHRVAALDYAGFCWLHPGEMAPGCGCPWSATSPSGARERAEARLAELTRQAERMRALERVVEAAKEFAEWHGGCPHHPDDCPRELELCRIVHRLETAFTAPDQPAPIEPEPDIAASVEPEQQAGVESAEAFRNRLSGSEGPMRTLELVKQRDGTVRAAAIREAADLVKRAEVAYGTDAEGAGGQDFTDAIAAEAALHTAHIMIIALLETK